MLGFCIEDPAFDASDEIVQSNDCGQTIDIRSAWYGPGSRGWAVGFTVTLSPGRAFPVNLLSAVVPNPVSLHR